MQRHVKNDSSGYVSFHAACTCEHSAIYRLDRVEMMLECHIYTHIVDA